MSRQIVIGPALALVKSRERPRLLGKGEKQ